MKGTVSLLGLELVKQAHKPIGCLNTRRSLRYDLMTTGRRSYYYQFSVLPHHQKLSSKRLRIQHASPSQLKEKPDVDKMIFGQTFTDHMLRVSWNSNVGWLDPKIVPLQPLSIHPGAKVLHYAQELFEGMKAFRGEDDAIRFFRPMHNMSRMNASAERVSLPTFDGRELMECIRRLVQIDTEWVPHCKASSLYIRPTMIGTEPALGICPSKSAELFVILGPTGPYYGRGVKAVKLYADPTMVRAWPGSCGMFKMGSNYAPTLWSLSEAEKHGCQQVLWLFGEDHQITEVGAMNIFFVLESKHDSNILELVTPSLNRGLILPGVTRRSIVELAHIWSEDIQKHGLQNTGWNKKLVAVERKITMEEVSCSLLCVKERRWVVIRYSTQHSKLLDFNWQILEANNEGRLLEAFGSGTAATISRVGAIYYQGHMHDIPVCEESDEDALSTRIMKALTNIYYGVESTHPWAVEVEDWNKFDKLIDQSNCEDYADAFKDWSPHKQYAASAVPSSHLRKIQT